MFFGYWMVVIHQTIFDHLTNGGHVPEQSALLGQLQGAHPAFRIVGHAQGSSKQGQGGHVSVTYPLT